MQKQTEHIRKTLMTMIYIKYFFYVLNIFGKNFKRIQFSKLSSFISRFQFQCSETFFADNCAQQYNSMFSNQQLSQTQLKTRQLSKKYIQLEQTLEYLNYIQRYESKRHNQTPLQYQSIDLRQVFTLTVQTTDLLYSASCNLINVKLSNKIYVSPVASPHFTIYRLYLLEQHYYTLTQEQRRIIDRDYKSYTFDEDGQRTIKQFMANIDDHIGCVLKYSQKYPEFIGKFYKMQFEQFSFVVNQLLRPNLANIKSSLVLIRCLQRTQVFCHNSLLLTVKAGLLYDNMRQHIQKGQLFSKLLQLQKQLFQDYKIRQNPQELIKIVKKWINDLLNLLMKEKLMFSQLSLDEENKKQSKEKVVRLQQQNKQKWQIYTKQYIPQEINKSTLQKLQQQTEQFATNKIDENKYSRKNNFILEYDSHKQIVIIKIVTELNVNIQNMDCLIYQTGAISQCWNMPSIELLDQRKGERKQKVIALSGYFKILINQHPTTHLLHLLDVLMVHSKILTMQINKPPYKCHQSHRFNYSLQNIERMNSLLLDRIKQVYDIQLSPSTEDQ